MDSTIQVRVDSKTKKQVKKVLDKLGLNFSSAISIYFRQINKEQGIPFRVTLTENGYTPEFEETLLREYKEAKEEHRTGKRKEYKNKEELFAALNKD